MVRNAPENGISAPNTDQAAARGFSIELAALAHESVLAGQGTSGGTALGGSRGPAMTASHETDPTTASFEGDLVLAHGSNSIPGDLICKGAL